MGRTLAVGQVRSMRGTGTDRPHLVHLFMIRCGTRKFGESVSGEAVDELCLKSMAVRPLQ
jgi:hypothetical protein